MSQNHIEKAKLYYQVMGKKDINQIQSFLAPQVRFISPFMDITGKEAVVQSIDKFMQFFKALNVRDCLELDTKAMVIYDVECPAPIGTIRTAAYIIFDNDLINRIELFFDARALERK